MNARIISDMLEQEIATIKRIQIWLEQNQKKLEHEAITHASCSYGLTKPQIFINAGKEPKEFAKRFGASFKLINNGWTAEFPDFYLALLDTHEEEQVIL